MHTRVFLNDTNELMNRCIKKKLLVGPSFRVCGEAGNAEEAAWKAGHARPDVFVTALSMPGLSCFDAIRLIRQQSPGARYLIFTAYPPPGGLIEALEVGVQGWVGIRNMALLARYAELEWTVF